MERLKELSRLGYWGAIIKSCESHVPVTFVIPDHNDTERGGPCENILTCSDHAVDRGHKANGFPVNIRCVNCEKFLKY